MKWIKRSEREPEKKDDLSEKYLAWDGNRFAIIKANARSNGKPFPDNLAVIDDMKACGLWKYS